MSTLHAKTILQVLPSPGLVKETVHSVCWPDFIEDAGVQVEEKTQEAVV